MGREEYQRRYREKHREELLKYQKEYYKKNFEKIAKRKHDKLVAEHKIMTPEEKEERHKRSIQNARERTKLWWKKLREDPERLAKFNKKASAKKREKYQNDPEFREHIKEYNRKYVKEYYKKKAEKEGKHE